MRQEIRPRPIERQTEQPTEPIAPPDTGTNTATDIWEAQNRVQRRLIAINLVNIASGVALTLQRGSRPMLWRALGAQNIGWGVINIGIGFVGSRLARRRAAQPDSRQPERLARESRNFRRILWINAGLDVLYMLGGLSMMRRSRRVVLDSMQKSDMLLGSGWGILLQGGILFVFDVVHALVVPKHKPPQDRDRR